MFSKNKNLVIGYEEQGLQKKDRLTWIWMKQRRTASMTLKQKRPRNRAEDTQVHSQSSILDVRLLMHSCGLSEQ
jgi:hypothetical protein